MPEYNDDEFRDATEPALYQQRWNVNPLPEKDRLTLHTMELTVQIVTSGNDEQRAKLASDIARRLTVILGDDIMVLRNGLPVQPSPGI